MANSQGLVFKMSSFIACFIIEEIAQEWEESHPSSVFSAETKFDYLPSLTGNKKEDLN